jgi:hypothetical protein
VELVNSVYMNSIIVIFINQKEENMSLLYLIDNSYQEFADFRRHKSVQIEPVVIPQRIKLAACDYVLCVYTVRPVHHFFGTHVLCTLVLCDWGTYSSWSVLHNSFYRALHVLLCFSST